MSKRALYSEEYLYNQLHMKLLSLFPFLGSNRFWAMVLMGLAIWGGSLGWLPQDLVDFVMLVAGGHVGIKSLDRFSEQLGKKK